MGGAKIVMVNGAELRPDQTFDQVSDRLDNALWQPDGGVSQGFPRTFEVTVADHRRCVNAAAVAYVSELKP